MRRILHPVVCLAACVCSLSVAAQQPPELEPVPEPPPAVGLEPQAPPGPGVTIESGDVGTVEERVIDGRRQVRVVTPQGLEYYLEEDLGDGTHARQTPGDSGVRVPKWVILRF